MTINVASARRGEAWEASYVCPDSYLREAVEKDLASDGSRLRRIMLAKWRDERAPSLACSVCDALNAHAPPDQIADLIADSGPGDDLVFTYTKADGSSETRRVSIRRVSGHSLGAIDHKDGSFKNFRIDRISGAHPA